MKRYVFIGSVEYSAYCLEGNLISLRAEKCFYNDKLI